MGRDDDELIRMISEARAEALALKVICAVLFSEIAVLHQSPPDKLQEMLAKLQGAMALLADLAGSDEITKEITKTIDLVSSMAEVALDKRS